MVYPTINVAAESLSGRSPEEIDQRLRKYCIDDPYNFNYSGTGLQVYVFWRLIVFDKIPLQKANAFQYQDIDLEHLAMTYRKRTPEKSTKTLQTFLLSNLTGHFLSALIHVENGRPCEKHYQRAHRRIFPPRRTIETWLQQTLKEAGIFNLPNREIPNLDFPPLDRDMESWNKFIKGRVI
ncbi:MAG: hypothetical protein GWP19_00600 [Planctomycetia bacterium]|nr:hypothetical protein [Planctomycetia bacterium]